MKKTYDLAGIGIGPFNLGLAALSASIHSLQSIYFDEKPAFNWHPGIMLDNSTLQVAFYADLVTLADPTSPYSFLAYLKAQRRLIPFGILEENYITRKEYNYYCKWVARQLPNLRFKTRVVAVDYNASNRCYQIKVRQFPNKALKIYCARKLVIGIGSIPSIPRCAQSLQGENVFHSAHYLHNEKSILSKKSVTLVGSGQSAAEVFDRLLPKQGQFTEGFNWITRSERFYPMDYSKLTLEMSTPDYIDYFYHLPDHKKVGLLKNQNMLYKGINYDLISRIYKRMYHLSLEQEIWNVHLLGHCELQDIQESYTNKYHLVFYHEGLGQSFVMDSEAVILATGYRYPIPSFIRPIKDRIQWEQEDTYQVNQNYAIDRNGNEIFIQNAEIHTHGFNAADLSLGPYRNAMIINNVLGYEQYVIPENNTFQQFGIPGRWQKKAMGLKSPRCLAEHSK